MAITIPRYDGPQLAEQNIPNARQSAAGAGNIAAGTRALAEGFGSVAKVAGDMYQREKTYMDAAVALEGKRALNDWEQNAFDNPQNPTAVVNTKGRAAGGLYDTVPADFDRKRAEIESTLKSPEQRAAFAIVAENQRARMMDRLNNHVSGEGKV